MGKMGWTKRLRMSVCCGETIGREVISRTTHEDVLTKTDLSSGKYFFGQRGSNGSGRNIVAGEPAPTAIDLAVPPPTWVAVKYMYNLASVKCQARRVAVIGGVIMQGQHIVWVSIFGEGGRRARRISPDRVYIYGR